MEAPTHVYDQDFAHEAIGAELGITRERARQIEAHALEKMRIGLEIEQRLGIVAAAPVLELLRGKPLWRFKRALQVIEELSARERMVQAVGRRVLEELEGIDV